MYVCMCVCIYICVCVCIDIYMYVCMKMQILMNCLNENYSANRRNLKGSLENYIDNKFIYYLIKPV